ncbi:DUF2267 domain-containing protein [Streptomyces avermitilis]|uniref:DUF2267 domain-containing protein n=1 Tax=Streptomyces avermitilis TaxID=33903 RepID=UPI003713D9D7
MHELGGQGPVGDHPGGAPVLPEKAEPLTRATLETLAERLTRGEAEDLASELPKR